MSDCDKQDWIATRFGSKQGLLKYSIYRALTLMGRYRKLRKLDVSAIDRLVFVCKGNICRSAYAEAVASGMGIEAISFGIDTVDGAPANEQAIQIAAISDIDLSEHKTTTITAVELKASDLLVAMEPWQLKYIDEFYGGRYQSTLLGLWAGEGNPYIHDPYGTSSAYFESCFMRIRDAVSGLGRHVR